MKSRFNDTLFGSDSGVTSSYATGRSGRVYWLPGTSTAWEREVGDLWEVPAAAACLNYEWRNLVLCPPQVTTGEGEDEESVPNHPLVGLLKKPNEEYDLSVLLYGLLLSYEFGRGAYLGIERNTRGGLPSELWYLPHWMVTPKRDKKTQQRYYEYRVGNRIMILQPEDIVHIRHGIDPNSPLNGFAPTGTGARDGYVLQQGTNYSAKAMKSGGLVGTIVTPDPAAIGAGQFDTDTFVKAWSDKTTGEHAGEVLAMDLPLKVEHPKITPQSMAIDTMLDRPEATIAALFGLPAQVVGLYCGKDSKTYANQKEAREIAWEEKLLPTASIVFGQIGAQLLPQLSLRAEQERCSLDISKVRPLQPDLDLLYERANGSWELNLIDRFEWAQMVGREPKPEDKGVYFKDVQVEQQSTLKDKQGEVDKPNQPKPARNGATAGARN
jgi:phage portal protein BeeE